MEKEDKDHKHCRGGCLHCSWTEDILEMDTVLYNGFGGYHVTKDGELFYMGDIDGEWDSFKQLSDIEADARNNPSSTWKVVLVNPLRGATWGRNNDGDWVLEETNAGFV